MDNLPLLKDVHIPVDEWLFPLGYGWLLMVLLLIFLYMTYKLLIFVRSKSKKYYALLMLKKANEYSISSAIKISEILRRVCLYKYKEAISLFGDDWIKFLNQKSKKQISGKAAELLVYAPYLPTDKIYDIKYYNILRDYVKSWIGENL